MTRSVNRPLRSSAAVLLAALLAGCGLGSDVRGFVDETYDEQSSVGDTSTYLAPTPPAAAAAQIAGAVPPAARATDAGQEFLRYDEDIVAVAPGGGGSTVRVEDLDGPFRNGAYSYLGPGFTPGAAGDSDDDAK